MLCRPRPIGSSLLLSTQLAHTSWHRGIRAEADADRLLRVAADQSERGAGYHPARVYRLLAQRYHPDNLETGNAAKFRLIHEAYSVLSDPDARVKYDVAHRDMQ